MPLSWFPPAPAAGPASLVELPPDDWALEPKLDGIRVIYRDGQVYTRQGNVLSPSKGAVHLLSILQPMTALGAPCFDGEWLPELGRYTVFDLPDHPGDYNERRAALAGLLELPDADNCDALFDPVVEHGRAHVLLPTNWRGFGLMCSYHGMFPQLYAALGRGIAEGVVCKRRTSRYVKQPREGGETRDWLKRRFCWDPSA